MCAVSQQVWVIGIKKVLYLLERYPLFENHIQIHIPAGKIWYPICHAVWYSANLYRRIISSCSWDLFFIAWSSSNSVASAGSCVNFIRSENVTCLINDTRERSTGCSGHFTIHSWALCSPWLTWHCLGIEIRHETLRIQSHIPRARYRTQETGCWSGLSVVWHLFAFARLLKWHVGLVEFALFVMW